MFRSTIRIILCSAIRFSCRSAFRDDLRRRYSSACECVRFGSDELSFACFGMRMDHYAEGTFASSASPHRSIPHSRLIFNALFDVCVCAGFLRRKLSSMTWWAAIDSKTSFFSVIIGYTQGNLSALSMLTELLPWFNLYWRTCWVLEKNRKKMFYSILSVSYR